MIKSWIDDKLDEGTLIFKGPYVQLGHRFESGDSFDQLIREGILHKDTPTCFTVNPNDKTTPMVELYRHQSDAIRSIIADNNTIIATGTGSGKSFCFGIPVVSECLKLRDKGVKGIKAILVYPMNALANSQYDDFAARLSGTGLKIAIYTGYTENSPEEALLKYRELTKREKPYDSELLSREEIKRTPPDILITNYVMLEYLLTRFEDKDLFPPSQRGSLHFLVLDEIHTYTGRQGADVAYLIRRLKQHTDTKGKLICIGTSATVKDSDEEDSGSAIADFAGQLFGEPFKSEWVIIEKFLKPEHKGMGLLPKQVVVTEDMVNGYDGTPAKTRILISALTGTEIPEDATMLDLGRILGEQLTVQFIENNLSIDSMDIKLLVDNYHEKIRPESSIGECNLEIMAAFLVGMHTSVEVAQTMRHRIIPKVHAFYSQGREIKSCLSKDSPHLNDAGEVVCSTCARQNKVRKTFPIVFCRSCGQEFYSVEIRQDSTVHPRDMDNTNVTGLPAYIFLGVYNPDMTPIPEHWMTNGGKVRPNYRGNIELERVEYCPDCHKIYREGDDKCICSSKMMVTIVPYPFLFCPSDGCGVSYDRTYREFNKMFSFGTVGRSTATDVIVSNTLNILPVGERKIIAFSDNRQDTALQAAHINNIQKRMHFRRGLYSALKSAKEPVELSKMGNAVFDIFERNNVMPNYSKKRTNKFSMASSRDEDEAYRRYLLFNTVLELGSSKRKNQPNLEDVGLLKVSYKNIDQISGMVEMWASIPEFLGVPATVRGDYLTGFLDIMRYNTAMSYEYLLKPYELKTEVENRLEEDVIFHNELQSNQPEGYSDDADNTTRDARVHRLSWRTGQLVAWTSRVLNVERERSQEIVREVANKLREVDGIQSRNINKWVRNLLMVNPDVILLSIPDGTDQMICKKCGSVHHFNEINICTGAKCGSLIEKDFSDNYFRSEYSRGFDTVVPILAEEHSGQIDDDTRKDLELRFRDPNNPLNVIVCTPTMELGIDIGALSTVYMRNVPPSPSNYAQRAGRAGRKSQASIVSTFCGVGSRRGPHDQYFYRFPERIISGTISTPRFLLNNKTIVTAHIHSLILETLSIRIPQKIEEFLEVKADDLPFKEDFRKDLAYAVEQNKTEIIDTIRSAMKEEEDRFEWLNESFIESKVDGFVKDLDNAFEYYRLEYNRLRRELHEINTLGELSPPSGEMRGRRTAIESKLNDMRCGNKDYFTYRYLSSQGFTPNYGFPTHVSTLTFDHRGKRDVEEVEIKRDKVLALGEYAPGNSVYYRGGRYNIVNARPKTIKNQPMTTRLLICPNCNAYYVGDEITSTGGACRVCGSSLVHEQPFDNAIEMPDQFAVRRHNITSDEEERSRLGYRISEHYHMGNQTTQMDVVSEKENLLIINYEHNGRILRLNTGTSRAERDNQENGFTLCTACNRWLMGEESERRHLDREDSNYRCWRNAVKKDVLGNIVLYTESSHDVISIDCPPLPGIDQRDCDSFYHTLAQSIILGLQISMNVGVDEVKSFLMPKPSAQGQYTVILYETAEGGAGILEALQHGPVLHDVVHTAREILHEFEPIQDQCEKACYDCLCNYYNQAIHELLNRKLVLPLLARLETSTITQRHIQTDDHYRELLAKCESDFEKNVLEAIYENGVPLPTESQKTIFEKDEPVIQSDFYYGNGIGMAVFVDGPDHDKDYVKESDEKKRNRIDAMGYRVFIIRYDDNLNKKIEQLGKLVG